MLSESEERLQSVIKTEVKGVEKRLDKKINQLDSKIDAVEHRLNEKIEGVEQRREAKIDSQGNTLQIFIDQQLRKTNGRIEDVAEQLKITNHAVTHTLEKQADLEERVEKLEQ